MAASLLIACGAASAEQLVSSNLSFQTQDQSMWDTGGNFEFVYSSGFLGADEDPPRFDVNPPEVSGGSFPGDYSVDPFFRFDTAFKLGMEVGASLNSGSIDANLDYHVSLQGPDTIVQGQPFSLTGLATKQGSSTFQTSPPSAGAYVNGVVEALFRGYARFETGGTAFGVHDYRMGNLGFTDQNTSNVPYFNLVNASYNPEIFGIDLGGAGGNELRVLGVVENELEYELGPTTITVGDWSGAATGALDGAIVQGSDEKTLVTASLDIDQLALLGNPALGTGVAHDWGVIEMDLGYDILDVTASLVMGLEQDFSIVSDVVARLSFSEEVMIEGEQVLEYMGPLESLPDITLLSDSVTVDPEFLVAAQLTNNTDLTFDGVLETTFLEAHIFAAYDIGLFGSGTVVDESVGPVHFDSASIPIADVDVYTNEFELGGFQIILGESFVLKTGFFGELQWVNETPGGGDFNTAVNWSPANTPMAENDAVIDNGGTAVVSAAAAVNDLSVGGTPEGGALRLDPSGDLTAGIVSVGENGAVNFHGGAISPTSFVLTGGALHVAEGLTETNTSPVEIATTSTFDTEAGSTFDQSAPVTGAGGLTKQGPGTLVLSGANAYSGGTTIEEGTLQTGADDAIPQGLIAIHAGGILDLTGHEEAIGPGGVAQTGLTMLDDAQVLAGDFMRISTLGAFVDYSGGSTPAGASIHSGELSLGTSSSTRAFSVADNPAAEDDLHISAIISNAPTNPNSPTPVINKTGAGRMTLSGANTFWRGVRVSQGTLLVESDGALGNGVNTANTGTEVMVNGTLEVISGVTIADEHLTLAGSGMQSSGALRSVSGENVWAGDVVLENFTSIRVDADRLTISGPISGPHTLRKLGAGTLALAEENSYSGDTNIREGVLSLEQASLADAADVLLDPSAFLELNFDGEDTIDVFFFDGYSRPVGTHGAVGSDADFEWPQISGTGKLLVTTFTGLDGDYNGDTVVDAADYAVWRNNFGTQNLFADGNGDGDVNVEDYDVWRENYGASVIPDSPVAEAAAPEPAAAMLLGLAAVAMLSERRRAG